MEACTDDAPRGGPFEEDAWSYKGECGHVLVHMKVSLPPIYGLKLESRGTDIDMSDCGHVFYSGNFSGILTGYSSGLPWAHLTPFSK